MALPQGDARAKDVETLKQSIEQIGKKAAMFMFCLNHGWPCNRKWDKAYPWIFLLPDREMDGYDCLAASQEEAIQPAMAAVADHQAKHPVHRAPLPTDAPAVGATGPTERMLHLLEQVAESFEGNGRFANADLLADAIRHADRQSKMLAMCLKFGPPLRCNEWANRPRQSWEYWLPGEEMSFMICAGDTQEAAIAIAFKKLEEEQTIRQEEVAST